MGKLKKCSTCGEIKELNTDNYFKRKGSKDGYYGQCKKCKAKVKSKSNERLRERRKNDKKLCERVRQYSKQYNKRYYEENKERIAKRQREQRQENKDKIARKNKVYMQQNPHIYAKARQDYRARKNNLPYTLEIDEWNEILEHFSNKCAYCGVSEDDSLLKYNERLHQEHFIPSTKGGEYTHDNIIPSCKSCNSSKSNKNFFEWFKDYEYYSKDREEFILDFLGYKNQIQQLSIL